MKNDPYELAFFDAARPERVLSVSQWSDEHRFLSNKASAEPGKWRTDRTPYLKEIMDCLSVTDPTQEVVMMTAAQIGKTETGNNWLGYIIDHAPAPVLAVSPTLQLARRNSKQRIDPLIEECPRLREKVGPKRQTSQDAQNTLMEKEFPNGMLVLTGANSAAGLRSMPARFVFFDEVDAYPPDVDGEGSPVDLAKARSRTFSKRKWFLVSTPTIENQSEIKRAYDVSDQRQYHVPCPHCHHMQQLVFRQLKWPSGEPLKAEYECIKCKAMIQNWQKTSMLKKGRWIPQNPNSKIAGFHLNSLYSPVGWYSWGEMADDFLKAKDNPERLRSFTNTALGETWKETTETPDWNKLYSRRSNYKRNVVPIGVCFITCGVDVQQDRLELEILGWCRNKVTYSIDYRVIMGDTSQSQVWDKLSELLTETFPMEKNPKQAMAIKMMAVDSGYNTQTVYNWVRKFPSTRVIAIKGSDTLNTIIGHPKPVDVKMDGKTIRNGLKRWDVGVHVAKVELFGWLRSNVPTDDEPDPYGFCHFPEYGPDFFKMLTAEELKVRFVRGFKRSEFQKIRNRNEALDCRVYNRAAASVCGIDRFTEDNWSALETNFNLPSVQPKSKRKKRKRESSWL